MPETQVQISVPGNHLMVALLGQRDELLRLIEGAFDAAIHVRGNEISVRRRPDAEVVGRLFEELVLLVQQGPPSSPPAWPAPSRWCAPTSPSEVLTTEVWRSARAPHRPKSSGQALRRRHPREHHHLRHRPRRHRQELVGWPAWRSSRCRPRRSTASSPPGPAVEAGERLGFLPGDLMAKVDPLRPLLRRALRHGRPDGRPTPADKGTVEVAPLAFMRRSTR